MSEDAKQEWLKRVEAALLRSPFYDEKSRPEALLSFQRSIEAIEASLLRSPFYDDESRAEALRAFQQDIEKSIERGPFDDIAEFLTPERAEFVRKIRIDDGYTFRAVAGVCAEEWDANWGTNQLIGEDLCRAAAEILAIPFEKFH